MLLRFGIRAFISLFTRVNPSNMQVIQDRSSDEEVGDRPFYGFLESCLRHNSEAVIFEAARYENLLFEES